MPGIVKQFIPWLQTTFNLNGDMTSFTQKFSNAHELTHIEYSNIWAHLSTPNQCGIISVSISQLVRSSDFVPPHKKEPTNVFPCENGIYVQTTGYTTLFDRMIN